MSKIILEEQISPSAPATNKVAFYSKAGGGLYKMNDLGLETEVVTGVGAATNLKYVAKNGVDATADGSANNPFSDSPSCYRFYYFFW